VTVQAAGCKKGSTIGKCRAPPQGGMEDHDRAIPREIRFWGGTVTVQVLPRKPWTS